MKRFLMILMFLCVMLAAVACDEKKTAGNESDLKVTAIPTTDTKPTAEATEAPKSETTPTAEPTATTEPTPTEATAPTSAPLPTRIPAPTIPTEIPEGFVLEWLPVQTTYYTTGGRLGREITERDYDENGNVLWEVRTKEIDVSGSYDTPVWQEISRREASYYADGRVATETIRNDKGEVKTISHAYDGTNRERRTFIEADGSVNRTDEYEFNADGKLLRKVRTKDGVSTVLYEAEYDASGRILKEVQCETSSESVTYYTSVFRYSENGYTMLTITSKDLEGNQVIGQSEAEYVDGRIVKETRENDLTEFRYEFDAEGRVTKQVCTENGADTCVRVWTYEDGKTVYTESLFYADGTPHAETTDEFRYDEHGNLVMHSGSGEEYFEVSIEYTPRVVTEEYHKLRNADNAGLTDDNEF